MSAATASPPQPGDRLERFRAVRVKLDPAGAPADADRFYLDAPRSISSRLAAELALAPASTHLVVGGVGSGKTSELRATERRLASLPDIATIQLDVTKRHDIDKMVPGAIVAQVGLALAEQLQGRAPRVLVQSARDVAYGGWEADEHWLDGGDDGTTYVPGILVSPERVAKNVARAREPLEKLLAVARQFSRNIVVLIDGLDRISDLAAFEQVIDHDVKALTMLGVGVVLVGPLRALYGLDRVLIQRFDSYSYQPWIDVVRDQAGHDFLARVLRSRVGDSFDDNVVDLLVRKSGGVLRDLMSLAQSALVEAYMDGSGGVGLTEVNEAVESFGRKHLQGLRQPEFAALQRVLQNGTFVQSSEEDLALLMTRRVLEYRSTAGQLRYAVHPTIEELLRSLGV